MGFMYQPTRMFVKCAYTRGHNVERLFNHILLNMVIMYVHVRISSSLFLGIFTFHFAKIFSLRFPPSSIS